MKLSLQKSLIFILFISALQIYAEINEINEYSFWNELHLKYFGKINYDQLIKADYSMSLSNIQKLEGRLFACICPINNYKNYKYYSFQNDNDLQFLFNKVTQNYVIRLYFSGEYSGGKIEIDKHTKKEVITIDGKLFFNQSMKRWEIVEGYTSYYAPNLLYFLNNPKNGLEGKFILEIKNGIPELIGFKKTYCNDCSIL